MTIYLKQTLPDGATVVADKADGREWVLRPGQYAEVAALPHDDQRAKVLEFVESNRADPTGGRTELDEQAMETMRNATTGEAHQESERGS